MVVQAERYRSCLSSLQRSCSCTALWAVRGEKFVRERQAGGYSYAAFFAGCLCFVRDLAVALFLRASLLQALLQDGNQIDDLGWLWRFLRLLFDLFSASFNFLFDHFHERFAIIIAIFYRSHFELMLSMSAVAMFISRFPTSTFVREMELCSDRQVPRRNASAPESKKPQVLRRRGTPGSISPPWRCRSCPSRSMRELSSRAYPFSPPF